MCDDANGDKPVEMEMELAELLEIFRNKWGFCSSTETEPLRLDHSTRKVPGVNKTKYFGQMKSTPGKNKERKIPLNVFLFLYFSRNFQDPII